MRMGLTISWHSGIRMVSSTRPSGISQSALAIQMTLPLRALTSWTLARLL